MNSWFINGRSRFFFVPCVFARTSINITDLLVFERRGALVELSRILAKLQQFWPGHVRSNFIFW